MLPDANKAKVVRDPKNTSKPVHRAAKAAYIEEKLAEVNLPEIYRRVSLPQRCVLIILTLITFAFLQGWLVEVNTLSPLANAFTICALIIVVGVCITLPYKSQQILAGKESIAIPSVWFANRQTKVRYVDIEFAEVRKVFGSGGNGQSTNQLVIRFAGTTLKLHQNSTHCLPDDWLLGNTGIYALEDFLQSRLKLLKSKRLLNSQS